MKEFLTFESATEKLLCGEGASFELPAIMEGLAHLQGLSHQA